MRYETVDLRHRTTDIQDSDLHEPNPKRQAIQLTQLTAWRDLFFSCLSAGGRSPRVRIREGQDKVFRAEHWGARAGDKHFSHKSEYQSAHLCKETQAAEIHTAMNTPSDSSPSAGATCSPTATEKGPTRYIASHMILEDHCIRAEQN
jgi:hypothetical protein